MGEQALTYFDVGCWPDNATDGREIDNRRSVECPQSCWPLPAILTDVIRFVAPTVVSHKLGESHFYLR